MENRWIAYVTGLPGCFCSSEDRDAALAGLPGALQGYLDWCAANGQAPEGYDPSAPVEVQESVLEWKHPTNGEWINAFFAADVPPLSAGEVGFATRLFEWTQAGLLQAIAGLPREILARPVVDDWSIDGIFYHTVRGDWAYLRALNLAPDWSQAPKESGPLALLDWTQALYAAALPGFVDQVRFETNLGEHWTPRKVLRRALWHRKDHTDHIGQFRRRLGVG